MSRLAAKQERRLKVGMVTDSIHPYHRGGKESRTRELVTRLASLADVSVYTMHWWDGPPIREQDGAALRAISPLIPMYVDNKRSVTQGIRFALACLRLLCADFDVLEVDHIPPLPVLVLRLVTALKRKPLVVTWHEVWGRAYWVEYLGLIGYVAWVVEELAMRLPDRVIAASPQTADRIRASVGSRKRISVAPNGIDLAAVAEVEPAENPTALVVIGRLIAHKRVDMLLEAVALLRTQGLPLTLRVIGNGPERQALHKKAADLGITDAVDFRHDVDGQDEVYALLKAARVCVFPSAREGFGIAALEALACGMPVITTSAPDNMAQYLVARSARGAVCDPTATALAEAVRAILHGGDTGPRQSEPWLAEYDWDAVATGVAETLGISRIGSFDVELGAMDAASAASAP